MAVTARIRAAKNVPDGRRAYCAVGSRPRSDDGYLENVAKAVFRSGFNWRVIEAKWPGIRDAFSGFSIERVAALSARDEARLMGDERTVRNAKKISAVVENARRMRDIRKRCGSFRAYLAEAAKGGERALAKAVTRDLSYIGDSMAVSFLRSVGEEVPEMSAAWIRRHFGAP